MPANVNLGTASGKITLDGSGAAGGAAQMQLALSSLNGVVSQNWWGLQAIGNVLSVLGGLGVAAFGEATNAAASWDAQLAQINTSLNGANSGTAQSQAQIAGLSNQLLQLAQTTPVPLATLGQIAGEVAKVGVSGSAITQVTKTISELGAVTGESTADMIESFGRFTATLGLTSQGIQQAGSAIFDLSRLTPSTAENIAIVTDRIDGLHESAQVTTPDLLGIASAVATIAPNARTAASTINQTFAAIGAAVDTGGIKLREFADLAQMSQSDFVKAWQQGDTTQLFTKIVSGLGQYSQATGSLDAALKSLGLSSSSNAQILGGLAEAQDNNVESSAKLSTQVQIANQAYKNGNDLNQAAAIQYKNFQAVLDILGNTVKVVATDFGQELLPVLRPLVGLADDLATGFANLTTSEKAGIEIGGAVVTVLALMGAGFFQMVPRIIQARAGIQNMFAALATYGVQSKVASTAGADFIAKLNAQSAAATTTAAATTKLATSENAEAVAAAKAQVAQVGLQGKMLDAKTQAYNAQVAQDNYNLALEEQQEAAAVAEAALARLEAQQEKYAGMTRNQVVSQATGAGFADTSSMTKQQAIEALTTQTANEAAIAETRLNVANSQLELTYNNLAPAIQRAQAAQAASNLAAVQAGADATAAAEATLKATTAIDDNTKSIEANIDAQKAEQVQVEATTASIDEQTIAKERNDETAVGGGTAALASGGATAGAVDADEELTASNNTLNQSYINLASATLRYNQAVAQQTADAEAVRAANAESTASFVELQEAIEHTGSESITTAEAASAYGADLREAADAATALSLANAEVATSLEAVTAAAETVDAALATTIVEEDASSFGLASIGQAAGAAAGIALVAATGFTALAGAHEKDAQAAKDAAAPNSALVGILTEQTSAVQADTNAWIVNQLIAENLIGPLHNLGQSLADIEAIIEGTNSEAMLQNFQTAAANAGKAGDALYGKVKNLAEEFQVAAKTAAILNGQTAANTAADSAATGANDDLTNAINTNTAAAKANADALNTSYTAAEDLVSAEENVAKAATSLTSAQESLTAAQTKQADQWEDIAKASIDYQKALLSVTDAQNTLADDETTLSEAQATQAAATATAKQDLVDANQKLVDSNQAVTEAQQKLNEAENPAVALNAYNDAVDKLANAQDDLTKSATGVQQAQYQLNYLMAEGAGAADIANAQQNLADAQQKQKDDTDAVADAQQSLSTTSTDSANTILDAQNSLTDAMNSQQAAVAAVTTAQQNLTQAQTDQANNKDYDAALEKVQADQLALQSATLAVTDAQVALNAAQTEGPALANAVAAAQQAVTDAYLNQAQANVAVQKDLTVLAGGTWTAQQDAEALLGQLNQIGSVTSGATQVAVNALAGSLTTALKNVKAAASDATGGGGAGAGGGIDGDLTGIGASADTTADNINNTIVPAFNNFKNPTITDLQTELDNLKGKLSDTSGFTAAGRAGGIVLRGQMLDLQNQIKENETEQDNLKGNLTTLAGTFDTTPAHIQKVADSLGINLTQAMTKPDFATLAQALGVTLPAAATNAETAFTGLSPQVDADITALETTITKHGGSSGATAAAMAKLAQDAVTAFANNSSLTPLGGESIDGFLAGMTNEGNIAIPKAVLSISQTLVHAFQTQLNINSPSKLIAHEAGEPVMEGFIYGMQSQESNVQEYVQQMAARTASSANASIAGIMRTAGSNPAISSLLGTITGGVNNAATTSTNSVDQLTSKLNDLTMQIAELEQTMDRNAEATESSVAAASQLASIGTAGAPNGDTYNFHEVQTSARQMVREVSWSKRLQRRN